MPYVTVPPLKETRNPTSEPNREPSIQNPDIQSVAEEVIASVKEKLQNKNYKNIAPVEASFDVDKIVNDILDTVITLPMRQLVGGSGMLRDSVKKELTRNRKLFDAPAPKASFITEKAPQAQKVIMIEELPDCRPEYELAKGDHGLQEGTLVANDQVELFLAGVTEEDIPAIVSSHETEALRAIYLMINDISSEECLMDSGSQINAMAKEVAVSFGLTWDPKIRINMQSANRQVETLLGLARNVKFKIGGIAFYLQIHILERPAYRTLLGRPFDSFTRSTVQNETNGDQMITVTDPNTGKQAVIPTFKRGETPDTLHGKYTTSPSF